MTTDAPLTDAERALLIEGYRQNIPDVVAACEWILLARVTALRETIAQEIEALLGYCDNGHCDCTDPAIEEAARIARGQA
jgi:hypothetical protein